MKIRLNHLFIFVLGLILFLFPGCASSLTKSDSNVLQSGNGNTTYLLGLIEKFSTKTPQTLYTNFNIEGYADKQNFKTAGNIKFSSNPEKVKIVFHDAVFRSSITEIIRDEDIVKIYFPIDKLLYIDNIKKINVKDYSSLDVDVNLISDLSCGRIPLIKGYSVVKSLESGAGSGSGDIRFIILENNEYYETISFKNDIVDKILWMDKNTKDKTEIYLDNPLKSNDILFYKSVKIISLKNKLKITVGFSGVKINLPIDSEKISKLNLSKSVKIINKN